MIARLVPPLIVAAAAVIGCAEPAAPPGGPPDPDPPQLVGASPESGSIGIRPDEVEFAFNEVINEQSGGGLSRLVLVSPRSGDVDVSWHRSRIGVRPDGGWRDSTVYVVTLLPGVADLRGNRRDTATVVVFSTGGGIPDTRISGAVFDWSRGTFAPRAYVTATPTTDTTLVYTTEADSLGRFTLAFVRPGEYVVRALLDANTNREFDPREAWDSTVVQLRDTVAVELYAFPQDSVAPLVSSVELIDSITIRVRLDRPLAPSVNLDSTATVLTPDSTPVAIGRVAPWHILADERAAASRRRADSLAAADTSAAARQARERARRDSINRAAIIADSIARDTIPRPRPPEPSRPRLVTEFGVILSEPLPPDVTHRVRLRLVGMLGHDRVAERTVRRPPPADTTAARRDTAPSFAPSRFLR